MTLGTDTARTLRGASCDAARCDPMNRAAQPENDHGQEGQRQEVLNRRALAAYGRRLPAFVKSLLVEGWH